MNYFKILFVISILTFSHSLLANSGHSLPPAVSSPEDCLPSDPGVKVDMACIEKQLTGTGLGGWVHAAVKDQQMLVFTWRRPGNFFVNIQLPMSSKDPQVMQQLLELRRHDQVVVKGKFFKNDAPIEHIDVSELKVVKAYDGPEADFDYDPQLPPVILNNNKFIGKVHIVANGGSVLVVEVGDRVIPVFNEKPEITEGLFRNDKIELNYTVQFLPMRPAHLVVNNDITEPVRVLERIADGHGETITLSGPLVMFPKSPQIKFNVFALRTEDQHSVARNFTIVNFSDFELFTAIREKLQEAWDKAVATAEYDRNKYINRKLIVTVTGSKNVVAADQANPQVLPVKLQDVQISFK